MLGCRTVYFGGSMTSSFLQYPLQDLQRRNPASIPRATEGKIFIFLTNLREKKLQLGFQSWYISGTSLITINLKPASSFSAVSEIFGRSA
jgi:hypothetical protein